MFFDLHLDLEVYLNENLRKFLKFEKRKLNKLNENLPFDFKQAEKVGLKFAVVQLQSLKFENGKLKEIKLSEFLKNYETFLRKIKEFKKVRIIKSKDDLYSLKKSQIGIILGVEGMYFLKSLKHLDILWKNGIRVFGLTWNFTNSLAGGLNNPEVGIKKFGKEVIFQILKYNGILDLAHSSEKTKIELAEKYPENVIFSHNNLKKFKNFPQNISDKILKLVKRNNILVGLTFLPKSLDENNFLGWKKNYDYLLKFNKKSLALGTDFLGFSFQESAPDCFNFLELNKNFKKFKIKKKLLFDNSYKFFYNKISTWKT